MEYITVNHEGTLLNEIIHLTKVEEMEIMLDVQHPLHNKLIFMNFLNAEDRGAISLAMVAIMSKEMPEQLKPSMTIEAIINCPDAVIGKLLELFNLQDFFTSDTAKAELQLLINDDDDYICLRAKD